MYEFLKKIPLFAHMPDGDLLRLCEVVDEVYLSAGEVLFAEGTLGDRAYVIKSGQFEILKRSSGRDVLLAVRGAGDVIGEMSLLEAVPRMASVRARTDSVLVVIDQEQLETLLNKSASAARAILHTVMARWRATEVMLRQSEKMAQLGTLAAGMAHELNNPAAAVKRGAGQLRTAVTAFRRAQEQLARLNLDEAGRQELAALAEEVETRSGRPPAWDALTRSDHEYELECWLEDRGVADAWELTPALVSLEYARDELAGRLEPFAAEALPALIGWLCALYTLLTIQGEIDQGAGRISKIVDALKAYSFLDQAPVQTVDVHEGLDNTLTILQAELGTITIRRQYAADLPPIHAYGSELNQVWTHIIDNAIDALAESEQGEIVITTVRDGDWILVQIEDNGPGVPPEIQARVFDPFFTTKPPGQGTGLGLNISYNVIVDKHRGDIKLFSEPGHTCFQVKIPVSFDAALDR